jgi:hypothetical protein
LLFAIIKGLIPNLPINFVKKTLPKTPIIVFPVKSNECLLEIKVIRFAPIIPKKIPKSEIKDSFIILV